MLLGFLTADYQRVADVHFAAGYVPQDQDKAAFMQACRSIAEPIRDRPMAEISVGRLLGQLFEVTERFAMQTQPQLLLLQKTMVVAEGVGRALNPKLNMWQLAQPLVEAWMVEHLGPEAQLRTALADGIGTIRRLPHLVERAERALESVLEGGVKLDPRTFSQGNGSRTERALWIGLVLLAGMALGMIIG
jgi:ubiquinone biosynthesis protein